jgi:hypothetical protein
MDLLIIIFFIFILKDPNARRPLCSKSSIWKKTSSHIRGNTIIKIGASLLESFHPQGCERDWKDEAMERLFSGQGAAMANRGRSLNSRSRRPSSSLTSDCCGRVLYPSFSGRHEREGTAMPVDAAPGWRCGSTAWWSGRLGRRRTVVWRRHRWRWWLYCT